MSPAAAKDAEAANRSAKEWVSRVPDGGWGWLIAGGVISILAAIYLFTEFPEISLVLLGLFAGVSLISEGVAYIMFGFGLRRLSRTA